MSLCKFDPIVAPAYPHGSWFEQPWINTNWESFFISFIFIGQMVIVKIVNKFSLFHNKIPFK